MGQEPAEQRRPLARAIGQDPGHKAAVIVINDRLRHGPEKRERMDVAIDPGLGHRRRISPDIAAVTMRKIEYKEPGFLLDTADHHRRLTEISLCMAGRMSKRHEDFLATLFPLPDIVLDDRIATGETAFVAKPVKHTLGRMALFARYVSVFIQPMVDRRNESVQLRPPDW